MSRTQAIERLRNAWAERRLALYLGAGVSVANGLPSWEQLVVAMYFDRISERRMRGWRPFANYLYAIAEWHLKRMDEPLEVTARRVRAYYDTPGQLLEHLHGILYAGVSDSAPDHDVMLPHVDDLLAANATLGAIVDLCLRSNASQGVASVVTYNYDSLLEHALDEIASGSGAPAVQFKPVWNESPLPANHRPIYHVHGYVPARGERSSEDELVFTEDQYHLAAADPYAWPNLVQLNTMAANVGCMVGLSLSDRNMRRLLDAAMRTPRRTENYALLQRPQREPPDDQRVDEIDERARKYLEKFERSGVKSRAASEGGAVYMPAGIKGGEPVAGGKGPRYRLEIRAILDAVESLDATQQDTVLEDLGIVPIWYDEHEEIPQILTQITAPAS